MHIYIYIHGRAKEEQAEEEGADAFGRQHGRVSIQSFTIYFVCTFVVLYVCKFGNILLYFCTFDIFTIKFCYNIFV